MKLSKYVTVLFLSFLLLASCHPDDSLHPLPLEQTCLLTEISCEDCGKEIYSYDQKNRLVSYTSRPGEKEYEYKQLFSYDAYNRISTIITYSGGVVSDSTSVFYADNTAYQARDLSYRWTHYTVITPNDPDIWLVKAFYDEKGRRYKVESYNNGELETTDTFVFDGNDVVFANYQRGEQPNRYVYEYYVDKKDKLRNVGELMTMGDGGGEPYSQHLIKEVTSLDHPLESYKVAYEFNQQGYPVKISSFSLDGTLSGEKHHTYHCK